MNEGRRPHEGIDETMALIEQPAALVEAVISVNSRSRTAKENRVAPAALAIVDLVRPVVGHQRLESVGKSLVECNHKRVVKAAYAVGCFVHSAESGIRPWIEINRRSVAS